MVFIVFILMRQKFLIFIYKTGYDLFNTRIKNFPLIKYVGSHIKKYIVKEIIEVNNLKMYLHDTGLSSAIIRNGVYEKNETEFIQRHVKSDDVLVDIGANIGYYTLLFAKLIGKNGKTFAFEPEIKNFQILTKNISINNLQNVILENFAISNYNGVVKLYISEVPGRHSLTPTSKNNYHNIQCVTLDDYFQNYKELIDKISYIKIDVEGLEVKVLEGMQQILQLNKNPRLKIQLEFDPVLIKNSENTPNQVFELLISKGFKSYIITDTFEEYQITNKIHVEDEKLHANLIFSR